MRIVAAIIVAAALAACSKSGSDQVAEEKIHSGRGSAAIQTVAADMAETPSAPPAPRAAPQHTLADTLRTTMLIRNGHARVEVAVLERAVAAVQSMARHLGGYVTSVATQTGDERFREATLTLRIPAPRFDEALEGLEPLGDVESVNVTSEDVGEEYVDVGVRLENGRRLERRLIELLQTRTGKLEEVLAVERELARVREEIERYEGRLRFLRNRADVSTLTVTVHEPIPLLANYQGQNVLLHSLGRAWRNFVGLVAGLIASLGIIVPVAAVVFGMWWFLRRRRRRFAANAH